MRFNKNRKLLLAVFALFTLLTLLIFWPIFLGRVNLNGNLLVSFYPIFGQNLPYKNIIGLDQLRLYFPNYSLVVGELRNFHLPQWNPYIFAGNLNMASLQSAVFYPLNLFSVFLSQIWFWHLLRISPLILGSFFTFIYLRNLKVAKAAAFFGGLSFGLSPFILAWGEEQVITPHAIVWLPLILYCADKLIVSNKPVLGKSGKFYFTAVVFSVAFSVFAGFIQMTVYTIALVFLYSLLRVVENRQKLKQGLVVLTAILAGFLISAVQILPTAQLYFESARSVVESRNIQVSFLLPVQSLLTYLSADFFGNPATWNFFRSGVSTYYESIMFVGTAVILFAFYEIFEGRKNTIVRFYFILGLVALFLTVNTPLSRLFTEMPLPVLSSSIANRLLFIPTFCLAVLAAKGMDRWLKSKIKSIAFFISLFAVLFASVAAYLLGVKLLNLPYFSSATLSSLETAKISLRNLIVPMAVFLCTCAVIVAAFFPKFGLKKPQAALVIILLTYFQLFLFAHKYFSYTDKSNVFPKIPVIDYVQKNQGYARSWGIGQAHLENNFATQYRIYSPEGYNSLNILSYAEFTSAMQGNDIEHFTFRADAGLGRGKAAWIIQNKNTRKLIDLLGVKYVIAKKEDADILEKNNFKRVFENYDLAVFENLQVLPRVFLASNYEGPPQSDSTGKTDDEVQKERRKLIPQKLLGENFDFRNVLILEKPSPISPQFGPGTVEIVSYKPQEVIVRTSSDQPKLLFLSDNFYPGWKAKVDGDETEILRADYTFRAVPLAPGEHTVRFYYDSNIFNLAVLITVLGLIGIILVILKRD